MQSGKLDGLDDYSDQKLLRHFEQSLIDSVNICLRFKDINYKTSQNFMFFVFLFEFSDLDNWDIKISVCYYFYYNRDSIYSSERLLFYDKTLRKCGVRVTFANL